MIKPTNLPGFMELSPEKQIIFNVIKERMEQVFRSHGFYPMDNPVMEKTEILLAKGGGETEKQVYRFDKGDTDITLRYDLTVPLAKYVAMNYGTLAFPFRRFQIGKVYRGERNQRGRFREFYQCDIDVIGDGELSVINDAEVPSIMCEVFDSIGLSDYVIRLNNRKVLSGIFEMFDVSQYKEETLRTIDKLEKIGRGEVVRLLGEIGVTSDKANAILDILAFEGSTDETLDMLRGLENQSETFEKGVEELSTVVKYMKLFGVNEKNYAVDLSIARGLDYYTGTVYETCFLPKPEIGSICSGGRYDDLAGYFTDKKLPGVGMSIGLTRLFFILSEYGYLSDELGSPVDVLVLPMTEDKEKAAEVAALLRREGMSVQIYLEDKKFKKKMSYADKLAAPYVIIIGEDEIAEGKVSLKNMKTGEQSTVTPDELMGVMAEYKAGKKASPIKLG